MSYVHVSDELIFDGVDVTPEIDARIRSEFADEITNNYDVALLADELYVAGAIYADVDWDSAYVHAEEQGRVLILCSPSALGTELAIRNLTGVETADPEDEGYYPDITYRVDDGPHWAAGVAEIKQAREQERLAEEAAEAERSTPEYQAAEAARKAAEAERAAQRAAEEAERRAAVAAARTAQERKAAAEAARAAAWKQQQQILAEVGISREYAEESRRAGADSVRAIIVRAAGGGHMIDEAEIVAHATQWAHLADTGDAPLNYGVQRQRAMRWLAEHPAETKPFVPFPHSFAVPAGHEAVVDGGPTTPVASPEPGLQPGL